MTVEEQLSLNLKNTGELEGGVFACISMNYCGRDYVVRKDIYTVKENIVYSIQSDGTLYATGDSLWNIKSECHRIGKYDHDKNYKFKTNSFSYAEIKKLLKL